jgi:hypothetical protein
MLLAFMTASVNSPKVMPVCFSMASRSALMSLRGLYFQRVGSSDPAG